MSLGYTVNKGIFDATAAAAAMGLRNAFDNILIINQWLTDNPVDGSGNDPLVTDTDNFGYSADEANTIRTYFSTFAGVRSANETTFELGSKMTGLS